MLRESKMKVELKKLQENDLEIVMDWRMRPYITKYMNTDPVLTIDGQKNGSIKF